MTLPLQNLRFVRRISILCCNFVRNVAYYRIGYVNEDGTGTLKQATEFGATVNANMLDIAVLEWCKLFADRKARHHWHRLVRDEAEQKQFSTQLHQVAQINAHEWTQYVDVIRVYRDKFVAHLDDEDVMNPPPLEVALKSVFFLYAHICANAPAGTLDMPRRVKLPGDLSVYYAECQNKARDAYKAAR
jgi:hypothetical protein